MTRHDKLIMTSHLGVTGRYSTQRSNPLFTGYLFASRAIYVPVWFISAQVRKLHGTFESYLLAGMTSILNA